MANWRQIQARIRKAKNSPEAPTKLADLYNKTRDAMVAFELATIEEKGANTPEAVRWYTTAAERFRRADWKTRAEEALARLGATVPTTREKTDESSEGSEQPEMIGSPTHQEAAHDEESLGNRPPATSNAAGDPAEEEEENIDE